METRFYYAQTKSGWVKREKELTKIKTDRLKSHNKKNAALGVLKDKKN